MRDLLKGNVLIFGSVLLGYCLAYPVLLADYFFDKPVVDILIYMALFVSSFLLTRKVFREHKGLKYFAFLLLVLPVVWLELDFWLYSSVDSPQLITYLEIILLGMSGCALLKYPLVMNPPKWVTLIIIPLMLIGFSVSYFSKAHDLSQLLMLFLTSGLVASFWIKKRVLSVSVALMGIALLVLANLLAPPKFFDSQSKYHDKVVFSAETDIQRIDVTEWKGDYWFYADGINQFSSIDSWLFYEPFAYPILQLADSPSKSLIIGGENGMLISELRKVGLNNVDQIPIDFELLELSQNETLFVNQNQNSLSQSAVNRIQGDVFSFLNGSIVKYDLIFIDVADPIDLERNQFFTKEFYELIKGALADNGLMVTQSGSPYFATEAFAVVLSTLQAAGFNTLPYHNQVLTLGEWSWTVGSTTLSEAEMKERLSSGEFQYSTKWLNQEAMKMMMSFGKPARKIDDLQINTMQAPSLYKYYLNGNHALK